MERRKRERTADERSDNEDKEDPGRHNKLVRLLLLRIVQDTKQLSAATEWMERFEQRRLLFQDLQAEQGGQPRMGWRKVPAEAQQSTYAAAT